MTQNRYRPYTTSEIARAVRLRLAGWHPAQIAEMTGRTKCAIDRQLSIAAHKHGYKYPSLPRKNLKWTDKRIEVMAREFPAKKYHEMARENGVCERRIAYLMAKRAHALQKGTWMG